MSSFLDAIDKAIGGNDDSQGVQTWLSTGFPPLDKAISGSYDGGMPVGRIVEIFGPSSCGKTAIATKVMANAQAIGGIAMFLDHERSFESGLAEQLGLDLSPEKFIFKTPRTFEESVTMAINVAKIVREGKHIPETAPIVVVFDSLAAMVPKSKMEKEITEQGMNDSLALAKATSAVFPVLAQYAEEYQILVLVLNQMRLKPGVVYGPPETTPGGEAPRYYASVRIQLGASRITEGKGAEREMLGQEISARCIKNKVAPPFKNTKWIFKYDDEGKGYFDVTTSMLEHLVETEKLVSSGPRITWTDGKTYFKKVLAEKIDTEGLQAELKAIL